MEESNGSPLQRIFRVMPILMVGMILMGMVLFAVTSIVPRWREYQTIYEDLQSAQETIAARTASDNDENLTILQNQIDSVQNSLTEAASVFMTSEQAEGLLDQFYSYAQVSGVQITSLQAQQSGISTSNNSNQATGNRPNAAQTDNTAAIAAIYDVQAFRLRIDGSVPGLMAFVARLREASVPGIVVTNLDLRSGIDQDTLMMDVFIYNSPFASGETYLNLPEVVLPPHLSMPVSVAVDSAGEISFDATLDANPAALAVLPPEPPTTLLLSDSFDSGDLTHWNLGAGWYLAADEGGQVLEVKDSSSDLTLVYNTLQDTVVQARVWLDAGGIRLSLRQSAAGRYSTTLDALGLIALYRGEKLMQTSFSATSGISRWRTLRVSVIDGMVRVSVDGVEYLSILDESELPPGTVSFGITGRGTARVDDVEIWVLEPEGKSTTP